MNLFTRSIRARLNSAGTFDRKEFSIVPDKRDTSNSNRIHVISKPQKRCALESQAQGNNLFASELTRPMVLLHWRLRYFTAQGIRYALSATESDSEMLSYIPDIMLSISI